MKIQLSERAVQTRINRKLRERNQKLRKATPRAALELGRFYIVDNDLGSVVSHGIDDLTDLAQELDALEPFEEVEVE